jgi:hypothetical protein
MGYDDNNQSVEHASTHEQPNLCNSSILLDRTKRAMYEARFEWWNSTDYNVIVLNSANSTYGSENKLSNIRFVNVPGIHNYGMARGEAHSLLYLQKMVDLSQAEWIFKITAKYIVYNLTTYIHAPECDMYVQKWSHTRAQNSEMFAFRSCLHPLVLSSLRRHDFSRCEHACWTCGNCVENWLHKLKQRVSHGLCYFPAIKIDAEWKTGRTHGGALDYL